MLLAVIGVLTNVAVVWILLRPALEQAQETARRSQSSMNMKYIGLAVQNYHDTTKRFPHAGSEENGILGLFMDGSVQLIGHDVDDVILRRMFCRNDKEPLDSNFRGR